MFHFVMGDETETTHFENAALETLSLHKTFNSKCHNNVKSGN